MNSAPGHGFQFLEDDALGARLAGLGVRQADCEEQFILGGGPGGQKINKTASTVRLSHKASGIEIRIQSERSRAANRWLAWKALADRIEAARAAEKARAIDEKERSRRRKRQKSRRQKAVMIRGKKHRAKIKGKRGRVSEE